MSEFFIRYAITSHALWTYAGLAELIQMVGPSLLVPIAIEGS